MVMEIREAAKIVILEETDLGGTVLKTERGHIVVMADECNGIYIPNDIIKNYKTRFFRLQVNQDAIILSPTKLQLEVVEREGAILETPNEEKNCGEKNAETTHK